MLRNGRSNKDPYAIVEITGSSVGSKADAAKVIGQNAANSLFKSDDIPVRSIFLGDVLEVWDPKKGMYRKGDDAVLGWSTSATTSPAKHATRASHAGALPVDLHSAQLRRRPVASLPSMGLEEACKRIGECLSQAKTRALSEEKQGLLWQDKRISIGTRFSGIGSVEEALHILQKHVPAKFQYRYACDHDEDSWNFHRSRFPPGQNFHFFKDVMDLVSIDPAVSKLTFAAKQKVVEGLSIRSKHAACVTRRSAQFQMFRWTSLGVYAKTIAARASKEVLKAPMPSLCWCAMLSCAVARCL